jgi:hypothetical protein
MVHSPRFQEFGRDVLARGTCEIGLHLHAWDSPPLVPLTEDDSRYHPYLTEYPEGQMREKVQVLTAVLEDTFGVKMVSHRAGRWSFDETYARILIENGYRVDCTVTPHVSWKSNQGSPGGNGGPDFSRFPETAYFLDLEDISRPGDSTLLELPVTIIPRHYPPTLEILRTAMGKSGPSARVAARLFPACNWLRPTSTARETALLDILSTARNEMRSYVEFMLHSSELMPGGSPIFPSSDSIEALYSDLEALFASASEAFQAQTLGEHYDDASKATPVDRVAGHTA